jgi:hypothetical protein
VFFNVNFFYGTNLACCVPMLKDIDVMIAYDMYLAIFKFIYDILFCIKGHNWQLAMQLSKPDINKISKKNLITLPRSNCHENATMPFLIKLKNIFVEVFN